MGQVRRQHDADQPQPAGAAHGQLLRQEVWPLPDGTDLLSGCCAAWLRCEGSPFKGVVWPGSAGRGVVVRLGLVLWLPCFEGEMCGSWGEV